MSTRVLATRQGTILLGLAAAALAGVLLLAYLNQYRSSVTSDTAPVTVLVARRFIEQGTSGAEIRAKRLYEVRELQTDFVKAGALTDAGALHNMVTAVEVNPGQQLTTADFTTVGASLGTTLVEDQRAIAIPIDALHGLLGQVQTGDRVDIYGGFTAGSGGGADEPVTKLLMQNVLVLSTGAVATGGVGAPAGGSNVVLRVNARQAGELAFATDNGKLWLVLRPRTGAPTERPRTITTADLLSNTRPISVGP